MNTETLLINEVTSASVLYQLVLEVRHLTQRGVLNYNGPITGRGISPTLPLAKLCALIMVRRMVYCLVYAVSKFHLSAVKDVMNQSRVISLAGSFLYIITSSI